MVVKTFPFFLLFLFFQGCTSKEIIANKKKVMSYYENGQEKEVIFVIDSLKDSIEVCEFYENGGIKLEYTLVNKKLEGPHKMYYENGGIQETKFYINNYKTGKVYFYLKDEKLSTEYVFYEDEAVYKKQYFYDSHSEIDSTYEEIGLIIDTNKKVGEPFFINEYSALGLKFPLDSIKGRTYIVYDLKIGNCKEELKLSLSSLDTIDLYSDKYSEIGYEFLKPCKICFLGNMYQEKNDTTIKLSSINKNFEVIDSIIYLKRQGINL